MNKRRKTIPCFPDYEIDVSGNVYSKKRRIILKPYYNYTGYLQVILYRDRKIYCKCPSRLVLETFVGACPNDMECCHNNGIRDDNRLENLRWDTHKSNMGESNLINLDRRGEKSGNHKLIERDVRMIIYMWGTGEFSQQEIANIYGVLRTQVNRIINKKQWKHIWR